MKTRHPLKKAIKLHMFEGEIPVVEKFRLLKEMGFDGVEPRSPSEQYSKQELLDAQEKTGLPIHGVVAGWKSFGHPDPDVRAEKRRELKAALRQADTFGASTVLLVPAIVNKKIRYDKAYSRSQEEISKVLPFARELGVKIALENVSNHFLYSPLEVARYIDEFDSPWIGAYFDVGNIVAVTNGWPEQWVRILGSRLLKLDIKEFTRGSYAEPGKRVKLGEGGTWTGRRFVRPFVKSGIRVGQLQRCREEIASGFARSVIEWIRFCRFKRDPLIIGGKSSRTTGHTQSATENITTLRRFAAFDSRSHAHSTRQNSGDPSQPRLNDSEEGATEESLQLSQEAIRNVADFGAVCAALKGILH